MNFITRYVHHTANTMDENLDLFTDFLGLLALEKVTGTRLVPIPTLTEKQKQEISNDALQKVLIAIYSPLDPLEGDTDDPQ